MTFTKAQAWRMKNASVYIGMTGYLAMMITGDVLFGAITKLIAELLRIPYFKQTDALDMMRLSYFFITASIFAIFSRVL